MCNQYTQQSAASQHPDSPVVDTPVRIRRSAVIENIQGEHVIHQLGDRIEEGIDIQGLSELILLSFTEFVVSVTF